MTPSEPNEVTSTLDSLVGRALSLREGLPPARVVLPEGNDPVIAVAADRCRELGMCDPVRIPDEHGRPGIAAAAEMLASGAADAMVAGRRHPGPEVVESSLDVLGLADGSSLVSSVVVMGFERFAGTSWHSLAFTDCAVSYMLDPSGLAEVATTTADTVARVLGWEPRVAMLTFSTHGSNMHPCALRVAEATRIARASRPDLCIDGEMQLDAALVPEVAEMKMPGGSDVGGRANVMVFPDLDAGNIAYRIAEDIVGARAYGHLLQGLGGVVCDLSCSSNVDDVLGSIALAVIDATTRA